MFEVRPGDGEIGMGNGASVGHLIARGGFDIWRAIFDWGQADI